jgi:large-conductance mechanosensitive channel
MSRQGIEDSAVVPIAILVYSLLSVFWPGQIDGGRLDTTLACIVHAVLYTLIAYNFSSYCKDPGFLKTPLAISCLLVIVYMGVPFLKYYGEARFIELNVGLHYRLIGLLVICVSIFMILKLYSKKWTLVYLKSHEVMQRSVGPFFVPLMYSIFGVSTFFLITGSIFVENGLSPAQITLIVSGYFIALYYFAFFGVQHKALWNELLFVSGGLAITYYSGQRFALLLAILMLVFARLSRIRSHKRRKSMVLLSLLITPLALIMVLGPLTELTKTRYGGVNLIFELQRTDFADFVGAASTAKHKESVVTGLHTSLLWAMPGALIDKNKLDYSMEPFFEKNGWRSSDYREGYSRGNIDYVDSIFSSGAMVGGFFGAFLLPLAWYGVFILILSQLKDSLLLSFYMASIPSMFNIEIAFWTIVPTLRNWVVISIILFCLIQLISSLRRRPRRSRFRGQVKKPGNARSVIR